MSEEYSPSEPNNPLYLGTYTIDDAIRMHLVDCSQCRDFIENGRPVGLGMRSGHCGTYWQLQLMRSDHEGKANNIVAYTELGDEARKGGPLQ
jgi:hypothetical protein